MTDTPTTEAGRRHEDYCRTFLGDDALRDILAIEAEARAGLDRVPGTVEIDIHGGNYTRWDSIEKAATYLAEYAALAPQEAPRG